MTSANPSHRPVIVAAVAASLLIFVLGLTYRALAARLSAPVSKTPLHPDALERFPIKIGDWTGHDVPLNEAVLLEIGADAYINRRYSHGNAEEAVFLFVAASGVTTGTLVGHAPEVCNVWSGHKLTDQRSTELPLGNGTNLPCRILQFSRGEPVGPEQKTVLYYYMADGQFCGNRSQLRSRVRRGPSMVSCVAQVQIVASSIDAVTGDSATRIVSDFAIDSASAIAELFQHIEGDRRLGESCEPSKTRK